MLLDVILFLSSLERVGIFRCSVFVGFAIWQKVSMIRGDAGESIVATWI